MKTVLFVICLCMTTLASAQEEAFVHEPNQIQDGRLTCIVDGFGNMAMTIADRTPEEVIKYKILPSEKKWEDTKFENLDKNSSSVLRKLRKGVRYSVCVNVFDQTGNLTNSWVFSVTP